VLLIALGLPLTGIRFTSVDAQELPAAARARQVDDALRADFAPYRETPITLAVDGGAQAAERVARIAAAVARRRRRRATAAAPTERRPSTSSPPRRR
jgi:uncharacterized membrane protein YdfJ with MMPL/SSD domain